MRPRASEPYSSIHKHAGDCCERTQCVRAAAEASQSTMLLWLTPIPPIRECGVTELLRIFYREIVPLVLTRKMAPAAELTSRPSEFPRRTARLPVCLHA